MKRYFLLLNLIMLTCLAQGQQKMKLSLNDALRFAQAQSLQSFLVKNTYIVGHLQYKNFKADYLPSLTLKSDLISYSNANQLRYNSITQTEDYVRTQTLNSNASLAIVQNVAATGGTFFIQSDLARNENFSTSPYIQFSSRPLQVGYSQELFGYNRFKWERMMEPKRYEQAKKEYLHNVEQTNITGCNYFFNLAIAHMNLEMAEYNYATTDTLLQVAHKRFLLGTIQKDELLELELNKNNSSINQEEAQMQYRKNKEALLTFLRLSPNLELELELPDILELTIPEQKALQLAKERNAEMLEQELNLIDARRQVAQAKAENRFQANLNVSYGINKADGYYDYINDTPVNGEIGNVYRPDFDEYQQLGVSLSVPILDWGKRKGQYQLAKSRQEIIRISTEQTITSFEQEVVTKVLEFNLQHNKVLAAAKSDTLAQQSYKLTTTRFRKGNVDVLKLTASQNAKDNARLQYIRSLYQYWSDYYTVRNLTLYNFVKDIQLEGDFDALLEEMR